MGFVSENDIKVKVSSLRPTFQNCTADEHSLIDSLIVRGPILAGELDSELISSLFRKGLIYFDIPVGADDTICINSTPTKILY